MQEKKDLQSTTANSDPNNNASANQNKIWDVSPVTAWEVSDGDVAASSTPAGK